MRKINYALMLLSMLFLASCKLTLEPETTFTDNSFWKTETDLRGACNRLDTLLVGFSHDTRSDELVKTSSDNISGGSWTVPSTSTTWSDPYRAIFTANNIIDKGGKAPLSDAIKNRWMAEAYFHRAYYHFMLVQKYGDVPLMLKAVQNTDDPLLLSARTPREDVIQQCYKDLDFAAQWLPTMTNLPAADWGRVTHSAALAMKVRIGLYEGTYSKYHSLASNSKNHLKIAIDAAELIINGKEHALYANFQNLFLFTGEGRQNKENIFVKVYGPNGQGTIVHGNCRLMENTVSVTRQMVDMFLYSDGLPREKSPLKVSLEPSFSTVFTNRDPRLGMTLYKVGEDAYKGAYIPFNNQHGYGYSLKKGFLLSEWQTNSKETIDKMLIRYAEVLISYAEALYEYNGSITDAQLDLTVNALRNRVGFKAKLTNAFATTNNLNIIDEIRREREVELLDEGFRYDDIIRWKIAENVLPTNMLGAKFVDAECVLARANIANRLTDATGKLNGIQVYDQKDIYVIEVAADRKFNPARDYLYPVPLNEISLSGGAVIQNPGW